MGREVGEALLARVAVVGALTQIEQGRRSYGERAWLDAFEALSSADLEQQLGVEDLQMLARSAYMLGLDDDYVGALERAHRVYVDAGDVAGAVRCCFWIGHSLLFRGQLPSASGWFARGQRLLARCPEDCVERGYLLIPAWLEQMGSGDYEAGYATAARAAEIGERFGDADLAWLARDDQARALLKQGRMNEGREASRFGCEPQPGLALVRLAQGDADAAVAAIRRVASETTEPLRRAEFLPAYVEIMLAVASVEKARAAAGELEEISRQHPSDVLSAMTAHAQGATALADGRPGAALMSLRRAVIVWTELAARYEAARVRVLVGLACRALGDEDSAALELDTARSAFGELGAVPDQKRVADLTGGGTLGRRPLTERELEVLRLVALGKTNRQIADALVISEHTVARHVQNIFAKLDVSSRTAAGAFAFSHGLV